MARESRPMATTIVKRFHGINQHLPRTAMPMDYAQDMLNLVINSTGHLEKVRFPQGLFLGLGAGEGPYSCHDYQKADGTRQYILACGPHLIVVDANSNVVVDDNNAQNVGKWRWVNSRNVAYGSNGIRALCWDGATLRNWGIVKPAVAGISIKLIGGGAGAGAVTIARAAGVSTVTKVAHGLITGDYAIIHSMSVDSFEGYYQVTRVDADHFTYAQPGLPNANATNTLILYPVGLAIPTKGVAVRYCYKNSTLGIQGPASDASAFSGAQPGGIAVGFAATLPTDPQVDKIAWYVTLIDGGGDFFFWKETGADAGSLVQIYNPDSDNALNKAERAPLHNFPATPGKYVDVFQSRIFISGMPTDKQSIRYSGYDKVLVGKPEAAFPVGNRLILGIGADDIRGQGPTQIGMVAWSKSNEMFQFKGSPEDITSDTPVAFSATLEQLPWSIGGGSGYTVAHTPYGLVWLGSDLNVSMWDGQGKPKTISDPVLPILRRINRAAIEQCEGAFYNSLEKEWYLLAIPVDGSAYCNLLLAFDLHPNAELNAGIMVMQWPGLRFDSLSVIETADAERKVVIGSEGIGYEVPLISSATRGSSEGNRSNTVGSIPTPAYYHTGYFGNDSPALVKMFRWGHIVADQPGKAFKLTAHIVDDEEYTMDHPLILDLEVGSDNRFSINYKGRRMALLVELPPDDTTINISEISVNYIPVGER